MDDIHYYYMNHSHSLTSLLVLHVLWETRVVPFLTYLLEDCSRYLTARHHVPMIALCDSLCRYMALILCILWLCQQAHLS